MTLVYVDVPIKIRNDLERRIADVFLMFDFVGNYMVANVYVPTILRYLGCVPTAADVAELVRRSEFTDIAGAVHLSKFLVALVDFLEHERMRPASIAELSKAFELIDPLDRKYVTEEELREALVDADYEPFSETEKAELLRTTIDRTNNLCWYEAYVYKLSKTQTDCIYQQAAQLAAVRKQSLSGSYKKL